MSIENGRNKIFSLLADILEYPSQNTREQARKALAAMEQANASARQYIEDFEKYCAANPLSCVEELYTETFDLQAKCPPYVGYHLFGGDRVRGMFMVKLKEHYRGGISCGNELPDHISVMLRSLEIENAGEETRDLKEFCLIPAVKKMIALFKDSRNPYQGVLQAVLLALESEGGSSVR